MRTESFFSKVILGRGRSADDAWRYRIWLTSSALSGTGELPPPTKPVTRGVFFTSCHSASFISISTSTYPGYTKRLLVTFLPLRNSTTSSVGIRICPILSAKPNASERVRNDSATLFSNPE